MQSSRILTGAALAAVLAAPAFAAPSLGAPAKPAPQRQEVELFKAICLAHEGDIAGAEAEAANLGLVAVVDKRGESIGEDDVEMLFVPAEGGKLEVMISPAPDDLVDTPGATVTFCAVRADDQQGEVFTAGRALADQLGLPAEADTDTARNYAVYYRKDADGMTAMSSSDDAAIRAAVLAGGFRVFDVRSNDEGVTMLSQITGVRGKAQ